MLLIGRGLAGAAVVEIAGPIGRRSTFMHENQSEMPVDLEIPKIEYNENDPLHRAAVAALVHFDDPLNAALHLLNECEDLLEMMLGTDGPLYAMAKDVRRRVRKVRKRLNEQERRDRDLFLAYAELREK